MAIICPTITATDKTEYDRQLNNVKDFAKQIHIDVMDGRITPAISLPLEHMSWPDNLIADVHLMYEQPETCLDRLVSLRPHMVIIHKEARVDFSRFSQELHQAGIKVGLAILQDTTVQSAQGIMSLFDQILIFSGHLGYQGGQADLGLLSKVAQVRSLNPDVEIAWDGGINDSNAARLVAAGVNVLNVGSFIQSNNEPKAAYDKLLSSLS